MIFKIIGGLLVIIGAVDLVGSYADFDLWGTLGVQLPELLWRFSSYIELLAGFAIFKLGSKSEEAEVSED